MNYKLVPVEPTEEMMCAGNDTGMFEDEYPRDSRRAAKCVYKAMLAAAPQAPDSAGHAQELLEQLHGALELVNREQERAERAERERDAIRGAWQTLNAENQRQCAELIEAKREAAELRADAERFRWYFDWTAKGESFLAAYMHGMRERWTLDQWRAAIDEAIEADAALASRKGEA